MASPLGRLLRLAATLLAALAVLGVASCSPRTQAPPRFEPSETAFEVLDLVNEARSTPRTCGEHTFSAVPPLTLAAKLSAAAQAHSEDMFVNTFMGHVGADGSSFIQRAERAGYAWSALAENVAFGYTDVPSVVAGWLSSPGHCENIMNARVTELGVGLEGAYWTQLFGAPASG